MAGDLRAKMFEKLQFSSRLYARDVENVLMEEEVRWSGEMKLYFGCELSALLLRVHVLHGHRSAS